VPYIAIKKLHPHSELVELLIKPFEKIYGITPSIRGE